MLRSLFHSYILATFGDLYDLPLIKFEIEFDLSWTKNCVLSEHHNIAGAIIQINNAKFYVPVVILSINDNVTFLENIKQRFKRTIS